jgi:hypothetical protein
MTLSFAPSLSDEENPKRFTAAAPITDTPVVDEPPSQEVDPVAKSSKAPRKPAKKVVAIHSSKRVKKSSDAGASLEAHQSTSSSNDVREYTIIFTSTFACLYSRITSGQNLMKKFIALGNECVEYLKAAEASDGKFIFPIFAYHVCLSLLLCLTVPFLFGELQML